MKQKNITLNDITIRNDLRPGDLGYIVYLHGILYSREYNHNIDFEAFVAAGLADLFQHYNPERDRAWICEHNGAIIGTLFLKHKNEKAQLRYFLIHPEYRGIGLGKKLMNLFMDFLQEYGYTSSFLLTTNKLGTAAALYKRHGFILKEEKTSSRFGTPLKEQIYEWSGG